MVEFPVTLFAGLSCRYSTSSVLMDIVQDTLVFFSLRCFRKSVYCSSARYNVPIDACVPVIVVFHLKWQCR